MDITPFNSNTSIVMGGQFPERVALGLSKELLEALRVEAKRNGRTVLAQIRHFCEEGLQFSRKMNSLETRLSHFEERLKSAEDNLPYETRGKPHHK